MHVKGQLHKGEQWVHEQETLIRKWFTSLNIYIYNVEQIQLKLKALMITIHTYLKISPSQYSAVSILWHVAVGDSLNQ